MDATTPQQSVSVLATATSSTAVQQIVQLNGLSFTFPPSLTYRTDGFTSSGESIDAFYANVPLGPACTAACGLHSFSPLPADAIVVGFGTLSEIGIGALHHDDPAPNSSIAGRAAIYTAAKPGTCGGDETITVRVGDYVVYACLTGPDLSSGEQTIHALLVTATNT